MQSASNIAENSSYDEEITLKYLILKLLAWCKYFRHKWLTIVLIGLIGAGMGFIYALLKKPVYLAELSLVVEDTKSSSLGAYASLASQFGIDLGSGGGSGVFSGENILVFLKSRLMVEKALLTPVRINEKEKSLIDLYIDSYALKDDWKSPALKNITFPPSVNSKSFTLLQDSVLSVVYQKIVKQNLDVAKFDKKLSFIGINCTSVNEIFSKTFAERLVKEATAFYVDTKIRRSKTNVDKLQVKADSLESLLNRKTYSAAITQDLNLNPAKRVATVNTELAQRDKAVLQTMYGEVLKNLEMSRMVMAQETPIIQVVDTPVLPLKKVKAGKIKFALVGGIVAGMLALVLLGLKKIYKDTMS